MAINIRLEECAMNDPSRDRPEQAPLNPALKSTTETTYDTENVTPAPLETTNAEEGQGEGWPIVWVIVTLACIALAIYLLL